MWKDNSKSVAGIPVGTEQRGKDYTIHPRVSDASYTFSSGSTSSGYSSVSSSILDTAYDSDLYASSSSDIPSVSRRHKRQNYSKRPKEGRALKRMHAKRNVAMPESSISDSEGSEAQIKVGWTDHLVEEEPTQIETLAGFYAPWAAFNTDLPLPPMPLHYDSPQELYHDPQYDGSQCHYPSSLQAFEYAPQAFDTNVELPIDASPHSLPTPYSCPDPRPPTSLAFQHDASMKSPYRTMHSPLAFEAIPTAVKEQYRQRIAAPRPRKAWDVEALEFRAVDV